MGEFDFVERPVTARRHRSGVHPMIWISAIMIVLLAGVGGAWWFSSKPVKVMLESVADQDLAEQTLLTINLKALAEGFPAEKLTYRIVSGPPGAKIDAQRGVFTWTPSEVQGPGEFTVTLAAQARNPNPVEGRETFKIIVNEVNLPPAIAEIPTQKVVAGESIRVKLNAVDADSPPQKLTYEIKKGPAGATVDANGVVTWAVPEMSLGGEQNIEVVVRDQADADDQETSAGETIARIQVQVEPPASFVLRFAAELKEAGLQVQKSVGGGPGGFTGKPAILSIEDDDFVTVLEYPSDQAARDDAEQVSEDGQTLFGEPARWKSRTRLFRQGNLIVVYGGTSQRVADAVTAALGKPFVVADASPTNPGPGKKPEPTLDEKLVQALAKLHQQQDLTGKKDYAGVRKIFAEFVAEQNEPLITRLSEQDGASFRQWLDDHQEFREEFLTALTPEDDLAGAWKILQALHAKLPEKLADYGPLAIAIAVTWDRDQNVDHYDDHQRRTHSLMPTRLLGAVENFEYFVDAAGIMQGRAQFLPWEFQVFLVNHKTPRAEREWAASNYVVKRPLYGKCYSDVPYDHEMLRTESRDCQLDGKEYTLANIRQFGGVCAMQADFAARVGKSIGVPAEYVGGEAAGGELHAWVMWVEIKQVSRTGISFTLESHGRYREDKYYVGKLRDPQTGRPMTDRELELRLQGVGLSPTAFRQARLVMRAYPQLRDKLEWTPVQEIAFLNEVIELCPGSELAWQQVAQLARDGRIGGDSNRQMNAMFEKLFRTFASFPDFTWKVFDDLVQFQKNSRQRDKYYERLVQMYEAAGRPDLACEARLKLCNYLLEAGHTKEVIDGLAFTIKRFPEEGRYVPKLLDKLESVCQDVKGANQQLLRFYQEFIPLIPQKRGNEPSPYCMRMLERAIDKFNAAGQLPQAQVFASQLAALKATE